MGTPVWVGAAAPTRLRPPWPTDADPTPGEVSGIAPTVRGRPSSDLFCHVRPSRHRSMTVPRRSFGSCFYFEQIADLRPRPPSANKFRDRARDGGPRLTATPGLWTKRPSSRHRRKPLLFVVRRRQWRLALRRRAVAGGEARRAAQAREARPPPRPPPSPQLCSEAHRLQWRLGPRLRERRNHHPRHGNHHPRSTGAWREGHTQHKLPCETARTLPRLRAISAEVVQCWRNPRTCSPNVAKSCHHRANFG